MRATRLIPICLITLAIFLSLMVFNPPPASADSIEPTWMSCGYALVDGVIQDGEWLNESALPVTLSGSEGEMAAIIYLMNNHDTFFLALQVADDELSYEGEWLPEGDAIRLDLDNDSSQAFDLLEDVLIVNAASPHFIDSHLSVLPSSSQADEVAGGETNGSANASRQEEQNHFELQHPLCSGDPLDTCLQAGDLLTFRLEYLDAEADGSFGGSYYFPDHTTTISWQVAECEVLTTSLYLPLSRK